MRPQHYEDLIQRGWRRYVLGSSLIVPLAELMRAFSSGTLYYKQNLRRSCCPHYTLRLEAEAFRPRRDQRKAINRWNHFILGPDYIRKAARLCPRSREYAPPCR